MDVIRRKVQDPPAEEDRKPSHPAISWIAIVVGVFITALGILVLFWGLSWQGESEESDPLDQDTAVGGPVLLPLGVFVIVVGMIWILNGYRVFGRKGGERSYCPRCGRPVEVDLDFCYHCGGEIPQEKALAAVKNRP